MHAGSDILPNLLKAPQQDVSPMTRQTPQNPSRLKLRKRKSGTGASRRQLRYEALEDRRLMTASKSAPKGGSGVIASVQTVNVPPSSYVSAVGADLQVTSTGPASIVAGSGTVTYNFTVKNVGTLN